MVLIVFVFLSTQMLPWDAFGQQTAKEFTDRGVTKRTNGDLDGAIADFNKAIELNPSFAMAYTSRGNAKKANGDLLGAEEDFAKAKKLQGR
jgi:Flp pilus assembly protein TadD